jgi:ribose/xylose/arabinose/galactoside ABC-type transport system permease subunit
VNAEQAATRPARSERRPRLKGQQLNEVGLAVALVALVFVLSLFTPHFATEANMWSVLGNAATVGIVAFPATLVIVAAEIDVSVGPAVALWGVTMAELAGPYGVPLPVAIIVTLVLGTLVGAGAGWIRAQYGVPSFIVTLGLWLAMRGLAQAIANSLPVPFPKSSFMDTLGGKIGPIFSATIIMLVTYLIFAFVARRTSYGRSVFAIGGNARAAALSGINVRRIRIALFSTTGLMAALLGIVFAGRLSSGNAGAASGLEFDAIAAVVVGGTSLSGGRGSMLGTLLGVLFIAVIGNGLVLLGVNSNLQGVFRGLLIVGAVMINNVVMTRRGEARR